MKTLILLLSIVFVAPAWGGEYWPQLNKIKRERKAPLRDRFKAHRPVTKRAPILKRDRWEINVICDDKFPPQSTKRVKVRCVR